MNGRRGFLALVSGATVTGSVLFRKATAAPTLILPPELDLSISHRLPSAGLIDASTPGAAYPLLAAEQTQMHAIIHVKQGVPDDLFLDWLEGGLRMARSRQPGGRIHRAMQAEGRV